MSILATQAPLLSAYGPYILLAVITGMVLFYIVSREEKQKKNPATPKLPPKGAFSPDEDPLLEFQEKVDLSDAPPIFPPNTPRWVYTFEHKTEDQMLQQSKDYYDLMNKRRSIRDFSSEPVPLEVIENIVRTAGTSPSGAHCEPWTFVVVRDPATKSKIRAIVEQEEYLNYNHRMGDKWVQDLRFINTSHDKPYLETAPYILVVFKQQYRIDDQGRRHSHYYYEISTALASGLLVAAIHVAGLVTVVTTPLNAGGDLRELLGRPSNEKVMLLLPVGYPADGATVPGVPRKKLEEIMVVK